MSRLSEAALPQRLWTCLAMSTANPNLPFLISCATWVLSISVTSAAVADPNICANGGFQSLCLFFLDIQLYQALQNGGGSCLMENCNAIGAQVNTVAQAVSPARIKKWPTGEPSAPHRGSNRPDPADEDRPEIGLLRRR